MFCLLIGICFHWISQQHAEREGSPTILHWLSGQRFPKEWLRKLALRFLTFSWVDRGSDVPHFIVSKLIPSCFYFLVAEGVWSRRLVRRSSSRNLPSDGRWLFIGGQWTNGFPHNRGTSPWRVRRHKRVTRRPHLNFQECAYLQFWQPILLFFLILCVWLLSLHSVVFLMVKALTFMPKQCEWWTNWLASSAIALAYV